MYDFLTFHGMFYLQHTKQQHINITVTTLPVTYMIDRFISIEM